MQGVWVGDTQNLALDCLFFGGLQDMGLLSMTILRSQELRICLGCGPLGLQLPPHWLGQ